MKAIVYTRLGPPEVLQLVDAPQPIPAEGQVLVRVYAASANALDYRRFADQLSGGPVPASARIMDGVVTKSVGKVLGADLAGRVEAVGPGVTRFRPGDEVFGIAAGNVGAFAEVACANQHSLAPKPAALSFEEAAAVPVAALTALQGLRDAGRLRDGQQVLIHGSGGGVGTFAVQIARALGAEITAVCGPRSLELARTLGAGRVLDYTRENFAQGPARYDLVAAVNGHRPLRDYLRVLKPGGVCVVIGGSIRQVLQSLAFGPVMSRLGTKQVRFMGIAEPNPADYAALAALLEAGAIRPVIDRSYPLEETAQAIRYAAAGHAQGKVVITIGQPG